MSVGSWDPQGGTLRPEDVERLLEASARPATEDFGLTPEEVARLAPLARHADDVDWQAATERLPSADLERLIRLFTLAEMHFPGWEAGAKSPVVPLAAVLKARGDYPPALTRWIRQHSSNRFLPHGSLLDRL